MTRWKVPMPKTAPKDGHVHFVMATKTASGARLELAGEFSETKSRLMWQLSQMTDEQIVKHAQC